MLEQIKSVSNPLTIIALFAALAEVAGTVAIKLVAPELQSTFIWFVMIFPTLIVALFFITLNFNAKVLYAPSDFKDEANYLIATNAKQSFGIEEIRVMLGDAIPEIVSGVTKAVSANGTEEKRKIEEVVQDKLRPIQIFAGNLRSEREKRVFSLLSVLTAEDSNKAFAVWKLLDSESRHLTLKEIATRLDLNEYAVSTILLTLIQKGLVMESPEGERGKTYGIMLELRKSGDRFRLYKAPNLEDNKT
jgi:hypothetical protein